jgi:hypothetical protein
MFGSGLSLKVKRPGSQAMYSEAQQMPTRNKESRNAGIKERKPPARRQEHTLQNVDIKKAPNLNTQGRGFIDQGLLTLENVIVFQ